MSISTKNLSIIGGAAFGAYTSDVTDNPISGIISTGIGAVMGGFMKLPGVDLKEISKVNIGPKVDMDFVKQQQILVNSPRDSSVFNRRIDSLERRYPGNLNERLTKSEDYFDRKFKKLDQRNSRTIQNQITKNSKLESAHNRNLTKINSRFDAAIEAKRSFYDNQNSWLSGSLKDEATVRKIHFRNRMIDREERAVSKYLDTPRGVKDLNTYDSWIDLQKTKRPYLKDTPLSELRNSLYKTYLTENPRALTTVQKIQERFNVRVPKDERDLFNPWHHSLIQDNNKTFEDHVKNNANMFDKDVFEINSRRAEALEQASQGLSLKKEKVSQWIEDTQSRLSTDRGEIEDLKQVRVNSIIDKYNQEQDVFDKLKKVLANNNIQVGDDRGSVISALRNINDDKVMDKLDLVLKDNGVNFVKLSDVKVDRVNSVSSTIAHTNEKALVSWFENQLGHNSIDAQEKAKMFLDRVAPGDIDLKDGSISFIDSADNKRVTVPLTSYSDDMRYHNAGNGNYNTVTQYNPYGAAYLSEKEVKVGGVAKKITAADVVKGFDPETMIQHLPKDVPISSILGKITGMFHYDSQESGTIERGVGGTFKPTSNSFLNSQGMVELGTVLNFDQYGEVDSKFPFKKIGQNSTENLASERSRLFLELARDLPEDKAGHMFDGVSMNSLTSINTTGFNSLAPFAPNERNETGVGNRGTNIINKNANTVALEGLIGSEGFNKQFSSSQVVNKLDVVDHELFNAIASTLYGNDHVLADGAGFFNLAAAEDLRIRDTSVIKIPLSNELSISHPELAKALTSPEGLSSYLENNPINIGNEVLGYDNKGAPIHLNNIYTSGQITGGFTTDRDIRLTVASNFDAEVEQNMKFFSTGTKSLNTGVSESRFNILNEVGVMLNEGVLTTSGGKLVLDGNTMNPRQLLSAVAKRVEEKKKSNTFIQNTLIGRAEDTGISNIMESMNKGLTGNSIFDSLIKSGKSKENSALTALMFGESKSAVDLTTTLAVGLENKAKQGLISSAFRQDFLYTFNADNFLKTQGKEREELIQRAYSMVEASGISEQYRTGQGMAIGSMNKGQSNVGTGNRANMSWTALGNLRSSGFTEKQLDIFGFKNKDLLYEVSSVVNERKVSKKALNNVILQRESSFLNMLQANTAPENRFDFVKNFYGSAANRLEDSPYLSYNLTLDDHEIKSINFSRISTNRSGFYEGKDGVALLKQLDNQKIGILGADIAFREAKNKKERDIAEKELRSRLDSYNETSKKMFSGNNSLTKSSIALSSNHSDIMQVKGIGGNADLFANEKLANKEHVWFISEEEAENKARQIGATLEYQRDKKYNNLKQPMFRVGEELIPLASLVTREPAQGPLSTDLVQWYVDETITGSNRGNAFVGVSNEIYYKGMFGDMDQDTVQTLLGDFKTKSQFTEIETRRKEIRSAFFDMQDVIASMKIKGTNTQMKSLADFGSKEEFDVYRASSALKGRNRKTLAAPATGLAVAYSKALEIELGSIGGKSKELTQGRVVVHQLVENLLKSAHLDTDAFTEVQEQAVEKLTRLRSGYLGKAGHENVTQKQYEEGLRQELPKFLNLNNIETNSVQGKATKAKASAIMENIITSEINHSMKIGNNPFTPLDLPEHRYSKNSSDWVDALTNIVKESSGVEMEYESGLKNLRKSTGQISAGMSDLFLDTVKSNKLVIAGGLGAMAGIALLGRSDPSFSDSRASARQHSASMLRSPGAYDGPSSNNTPMGIETNPTKAGYITPKSFNNKSINVAGEFIGEGDSLYSQYSELTDTSNLNEQAYNIANAAFGNNLRSARLQTN